MMHETLVEDNPDYSADDEDDIVRVSDVNPGGPSRNSGRLHASQAVTNDVPAPQRKYVKSHSQKKDRASRRSAFEGHVQDGHFSSETRSSLLRNGRGRSPQIHDNEDQCDNEVLLYPETFSLTGIVSEPDRHEKNTGRSIAVPHVPNSHPPLTNAYSFPLVQNDGDSTSRPNRLSGAENTVTVPTDLWHYDRQRLSNSRTGHSVQHEDLADYEFLDNYILLDILQERFRELQPYTYVGDSLVAVNPCQTLNIYSQEFHRKYRDLRVRSKERAHIFWVAEQTYRKLLTTGTSQCIVVSGDSGAGKTESVKHILKHLVQSRTASASQDPGLRGREPFVPDIVAELETANPLLELFGNASTELNKNSSRFGKLQELEYDAYGNLAAVRLECFMLEKFRVTSDKHGDKNFHVFYTLLAGLPESTLTDLGLDRRTESYRILNPSDPTKKVFETMPERKRYRKQFAQMSSLLTGVGFQQQEISSLFKLVSAILLLSNVEFQCDDVGNVGILDNVGQECLKRAVRVLGLEDNAEEMENCLLRVDQESRERVSSLKTLRQAEKERDSLAQELYTALFYGVVDRINSALQDRRHHTTSARFARIRLLDIPGFENMTRHNGFEQFMINSTNEKLHQYFLHHAIRTELEECARENLPEMKVEFTDNTTTVDLIFTEPRGLIPLLEHEVSTDDSDSDRGWLAKCTHSRHIVLKPNTSFLFHHYAGPVEYSAKDFVTKNTNTLSNDLRDVIQRSENFFIKNYFVTGREKPTILHRSQTRFTDHCQKSLSRILDKPETSPVFVRCIKPNVELQAGWFDKGIVMHQLRSSGLPEVIKVRKEGYPIRIQFPKFVKRYGTLLGIGDISTWMAEEQMHNACVAILSSVHVTGHQMGGSKVFLKMHHRDLLEEAMAAKEREERDRQEREERDGQKSEELQEGKEADSISADTNRTTLSSESGFASDQRERTKADKGLGGQTVVQMEETEENKEEEKKNETVEEQPAYDVFRVSEREAEYSTELEMKVRRCVRLFMYLVIFCLTLLGGVLSRMALIWLSSAQLKFVLNPATIDLKKLLGRNEDINKFREGLTPTRLLICQLLPLMLTWLSCLIKAMFGRKDWPSLKACVVVAVLDVICLFGRFVFIFKILPNSNSTEILIAVIMGTAVCQIPGALKLRWLLITGRPKPQGPTSKKARWLSVRHYFHVFVVFLALCVQLGVVAALFYGNDVITKISSHAKSIRLPELWALVVTVCCASLSWWGNFAHGTTADCGESYNDHHKQCFPAAYSLFVLKMKMAAIRQTSFVYTGPVQMVVLVALFVIFHHNDINITDQLNVFFDSLATGLTDIEVLTSHLITYGLMYIQLATTLFVPFLATLACRLSMQQLAFAAPLVLVTPACLVLAVLCAPVYSQFWYQVTSACDTPDIKDTRVWFLLVVGAVVWASALIINSHIWYPDVERIAKVERLFQLPYRDPVFLDIGLQCSRLQDALENAESVETQHKKSDDTTSENAERPKVYLCATMWHESRHEMLQLLKSLFRIDLDVYTRKRAMRRFQISEAHSDLYEPEIHVIFDDAFKTDKETQQRVLNSWVRQFIDVIAEVIRTLPDDVQRKGLIKAVKITTPYGGRLEWRLPGGTPMCVHLKDKERIRNKKRWSQVLYMYYLLGYKLMPEDKTAKEVTLDNAKSSGMRLRRRRVRNNTSILNSLHPDTVNKAENIFLMTLDGDIDFRPDAVHMLLDRMKKNKKVAAVCGRIHPIGSGPMVWYQQFEYAVGHWLQKATEHVFGCVLCCPGCFSLLRGSALMDDNVMKTYTKEPTEAGHYIQYEQGEDRWLCTLLLQQGWRIEYCAGVDALTFAPRTFHEFYTQRRRWSPSTMANIMDLIGSWRLTVKMNDSISVIFMLYLFVVMGTSILAPGLVVYMIAGSYDSVLEIGLWNSYLLSVLPVFLYLLLCLKAKAVTQINVAAVMSAVYTIVMLLVTVGTILNIATSDIYSPNVLFLICVAAIFVVAGFVHPKELFCLFHGVLYFITVPSTFVFLTVFFLCNLHDVSWGTREQVEKDDLPAKQEDIQSESDKGKLRKFFDKLGLTAILQDIKSFVQQMMGIRQEVQQQTVPNDKQNGESDNPPVSSPKKVPPPIPPKPKLPPKVEPDPTFWAKEIQIPNSSNAEISERETEFWQFLIRKYLFPLKHNEAQQQKIKADLISIRNNVVFAYMLLNFMFTLVLLQLKLKMNELRDTFYIVGKYEPVSTVSLAIFASVLVTQFLGMLGHRWGTFVHLISSTKISWFRRDEEEERASEAINEAEKLVSASATGDLDLPPDYSDDEETDDSSTSFHQTKHQPQEMPSTLAETPFEHAPDYPEGDEGDNEDVPYDIVFEKNFRTARKYLERERSPRRTPLYQKKRSTPTYRPGYNRYDTPRHGRRQQLYRSISRAPSYLHHRGDVLHV